MARKQNKLEDISMRKLFLTLSFLSLVVVLFITTTGSVSHSPSDGTNLYGYTTDGDFFIYKSLWETIGMKTAPSLITRVTKGAPMSMDDKGDKYVFHTDKKLGDTEKYCFVSSDGDVPYVFKSKWDHQAKKHMNLINEADVVDNGMDGFDFVTGPRPMN